MKTRVLFFIFYLGFCAIIKSPAQGVSAFSYQGRLNAGGVPANSNYDLIFRLYTTNAGGSAFATVVTNLGVPVINGLFTTTLDFGNVFNGNPLWLEIGVRVAGKITTFTMLSPRQSLATSPSALYSLTSGNVTGVLGVTNLPANVALLNGNANFTGTITAGAFSGNGAGLTNLSAAGTTPASSTNQGALSSTGYAALNTLVPVQLTATPFKTPPMGVMSWNCCGSSGATESFCLYVATNMITNGLQALGYNFIGIDAGWQGYRDTNGFIHESLARFPDGISNTVTILHSLGFKVGIYTSIGLTNIYTDFFSDDDSALINTNFSNEQELINDAQTYIKWGIDYVKLEGSTNLYTTEEQEQRWYETFATAAQNAGKPLYIMGAVGNECSPWMYGVLNARRSGGFDMGSYVGNPQYTFSRFMGNFLAMSAHPEYSGPGSFCSLDAIPAFDPAQSTFMLMYAMMNAEIVWSYFEPFGTGLTDAAYLTNIIQIDQDPAALMARCVLTNGSVTVWKKPLGSPASPTFALAFLNSDYGDGPVSTTISFQNLGVTSSPMICLDLISNVTSLTSNSITVSVPPMRAYGFKFSPCTPAAVVRETSNYTPAITDHTILVASSGATITLPSAVATSGFSYVVKLTVAGSCTVATSNGEKIDGATSYSLSAQYKYVTVQSDGVQWWVIASN